LLSQLIHHLFKHLPLCRATLIGEGEGGRMKEEEEEKIIHCLR